MNDYRSQYDRLHFSELEKQAMTDRLLAAHEERTGSRRVGRLPRRGALVAAAALLVLTVTAGATGALGSAGEVLAGIFGGSAAQTEVIDKIGYPIGASDTDKGVTITAQAILADRYSYAILYTIEREDGQPLLGGLAEERGWAPGNLPLVFSSQGGTVYTAGPWGGGQGYSWFYDEDPADPAIQYVEVMTLDRPIRPGTARVVFKDLEYFGEEAEEKVSIAEGKWKLSFDFAYEDLTVDLPAGQRFRLSGMDAVLDEVALSPLSLQVSYTVESEMPEIEAESGREPEEMHQTVAQYFDNLELLVELADGTVLDLSDAGGSVHTEDGRTLCTKGAVFEEIHPLEEIVSVTVGEVVLPVGGEETETE